MSRTVPSFTEEGLKRFMHGMDKRIKDLERGGDWRFDTETDPEDASALLRNAAQLLCMSATTDSIASGGDYVTFGSIVAQHAFSTVSVAGQSWTHPVSGVYVLTYEHEWDSYTGGGTIELELDGVDVPDGLIGASSAGREGRGTIAYLAAAEQVGKIKVTQSSGSDQTFDALVRVAISDPAPLGDVFDAFQITPTVPLRPVSATGEVFVDVTFDVVWRAGAGTLILASQSDGTGVIGVDNQITMDVTHEDGSTAQYQRNEGAGGAMVTYGPVDVTAYFEAGANSVRVQLADTAGGSLESTSIWLVRT